MTTELGYRLKEHMYKMLYNNLRDEIGYQIEDVWGAYFDRLVVAQDNAAKDQQAAFASANRAQEEYARRTERAFAVFNFVCSLSLSWVGAYLQYRVAPKYFGRKDWVEDGASLMPRFVVVSEDKVAGKLFGDAGKELAGALMSLGLKNTVPRAYTEPDGRGIANALTLEEFRAKLKVEITKQKNNALGSIEEITNSLENDSDAVGDKLVKYLLSDPANQGLDKRPLAAQEAAGKIMINSWINDWRKGWAKKWTYYGNDPPTDIDPFIRHRMEKLLWFLWLWENKKDLMRDWSTDFNAGRLKWLDSIVDHLFELNFPVMELILRRGKNRLDALSRFHTWIWKYQPEPVVQDSRGKPRALTPIETWTRPHQ